MRFKPPGQAERLRAVGSTQDLPEALRRALDPGSDFEPMPVPKPGDWLAVHPEPGQTFEDFAREKWKRPDRIRNKVYLQPLGEFPEAQSPSVEILEQYVAAYFAMEAEALSPLTLGKHAFTTRLNPFTGNRQVLAGDVLAFLRKRLRPDAFCIMAITMEDLYPDPSWNFVFGQASLRKRVGVYSFARYDPAFYGEERGRDYRQVLLERSCRVLVHEIAHMFGLKHCIFFRCVLNGSNHLQESDARPLHLCPVCLHKLQFSIGFDVLDRFRQLVLFYQRVGFDEARWVANRIQSG